MNRTFLFFLWFSMTGCLSAQTNYLSPVWAAFLYGGYEVTTNRFDAGLLQKNFVDPQMPDLRGADETRRYYACDEYWARKGLVRTFRMEQAFLNGNMAVVSNELFGVAADMREVAKTEHWEMFLSHYVQTAVYPLFRILESSPSWRAELGDELLTRVLLGQTFGFSEQNPKNTLTLLCMLVLSNRIVLYERRNGHYPESLEELHIADGVDKNAWGSPIIYKLRSKGRWLLKSIPRDGVDDGSDIDAAVPFVDPNCSICFFDGLSRVRRQLLENKMTILPTAEARKNKEVDWSKVPTLSIRFDPARGVTGLGVSHPGIISGTRK